MHPQLSDELALPTIVHTRGAVDDTLSIRVTTELGTGGRIALLHRILGDG